MVSRGFAFFKAKLDHTIGRMLAARTVCTSRLLQLQQYSAVRFPHLKPYGGGFVSLILVYSLQHSRHLKFSATVHLAPRRLKNALNNIAQKPGAVLIGMFHRLAKKQTVRMDVAPRSHFQPCESRSRSDVAQHRCTSHLFPKPTKIILVSTWCRNRSLTSCSY